RAPSNARLRRIVHEPPVVGPVSSGEDPAEQLFTESFTFTEGPHIILPGVVSHASFILRNLLKAIFLSSDSFVDQELADQIFRLAGSTLQLSTLIAGRAQLERGISPISLAGGRVLVPPAGRLAELVRAGSFTNSEFRALFGTSGAQALEALTAEA